MKMRLGADVAPVKSNTGSWVHGSGPEPLTALRSHLSGRTDDAKDVPDAGHKDDQEVDHENETKCDGDVSGPMEGFVGKQDLKHRPADL